MGRSRPKAGTVLESAGYPIPVPQVAPGVTETLFEQPSVIDVIPTSPVTTSSVRYMLEGTATSGATGVAEGAAKPASDLALETVDEPVVKIATSLTVSDELLEDASSVQSYLNSRLSLFVRLEEEHQILRGGGTNDLDGIFGRSGLNTYPAGTADNNAVAVFKAAMGTRGSSYLEPDLIVMHPDNWQATRLLMDGSNQFYGGGPFSGAYGGAAQAGASGGSRSRCRRRWAPGPRSSARSVRRRGCTDEAASRSRQATVTTAISCRTLWL